MVKNGNRPATADDEVLQRACANVHYTVNDLAALRKLFAKHDADKSGSLDIDEFYALFRSKKSPFGDQLFRLVDLDGDGEFLSFSEFVSVVSTYCLFGPEEILRFAFNVVDEDKSGFVSMAEMDNLAAWLHKDGPANLNTAMKKIQEKYDQGDGNISFESFRQINREFPFLFHPAFALQDSMMQCVLGQRWWDRKRRELGMIKDGAASEKPPGSESPGLLGTLFPSIFPPKPIPGAAGEEGADGEGADAEEDGIWGKAQILPPPGPELLAYRDFVTEVSAVEKNMESQRKARRRAVAAEKRVAAARELQLKRDRTAKRRARMLTDDLMDPMGEPLTLVHQPASVVRLFGK